MPARRATHPLRRAALAILVLGVAYGAIALLAPRLIGAALEDAAARKGFRAVPGYKVSAGLLSGDVCISTLGLVPLADAPAADVSGSLHIDRLELEGLGYWQWFVHDIIDADAAVLMIRSARLRLHPPDSTDRAASSSKPFRFRADSLRIEVRDAALELPSETDRTLHAEAIQVSGSGFTLAPDSGLRVNNMRLRSAPFRATGVLDGSVGFDSLHYTSAESSLVLEGLRGGPPVDSAIARASQLKIERDVVAGSIRRIVLSGLDLDRAVSRGDVWCDGAVIDGARITVARDKVLPDSPWRYKPLPGKLLRTLGSAIRIEEVVISDMDVTYHERTDRELGFAPIPFRGITGTLRHLHGPEADSASLALDARCMAFERTPVHLLLTGDPHDTTGALLVEASLGKLPLRHINAAIGRLQGVEAAEGVLDTLIYRMHAGDRTASGVIWMTYKGLRVAARDEKASGIGAAALDLLLNLVVKKELNNESKKDGWVSYSFERRRDRFLFNYLWAGVREGAKHAMLPGIVPKEPRRKR